MLSDPIFILILIGFILVMIPILIIRNPPTAYRELQLAWRKGFGQFISELLRQYVHYATRGSPVWRRIGIIMSVGMGIFILRLTPLIGWWGILISIIFFGNAILFTVIRE
jgi:hypothetical protein